MIRRVAELLEGALRTAGLETTSVLWQIGQAWPDIVGPRVAARATPRHLRRGELTLAAPDAVWRQELTLLGPEIAASVNRKLGSDAVQRVRLVAGPVHEPARTPRSRRIRPSGPPAISDQGDGAHAGDRADAAAPGDLASALEALRRARSERLAADRRRADARASASRGLAPSAAAGRPPRRGR